MNENKISSMIVDAAIEVHRELGGPGLLEGVYEEALTWELHQKDLNVQQQKPVPIHYKGNKLSSDLRLDLLVHDLVIVECKAMTEENDVYRSQLLTYLRLSGKKLGLLINFGARYVKEGITRVVHDL